MKKLPNRTSSYKDIQTLLMESERRYRRLVRLAPDIIYSIDPNGIILSLNPAFEQVTGWQITELIGKSIFTIISDNDLTAAKKRFKIKNAPSAIKTFELTTISRSGKLVLLEFRNVQIIQKGKLVQSFGIARDITLRKKVEDLQTFQNILMKTQADAWPGGILILSPEGKVIFYNSQFHAIWQLSEDQLKNLSEEKRVALVRTKVKYPRTFARTIHSINDNEQIKQLDEVELKDGKTIERFTSPLHDTDGNFLGRAWFFRDITERNREMKRQEYFFDFASHEMKNPLASIKAYTHLIKKFTSSKDEKILEFLIKIDAQVNKVNKVMYDFLDIAYIRSNTFALEKESIDFDAFMNELVQDAKHSTTIPINLLGMTHAAIKADPYRLSQAFGNILNNAIKYASGTKEIDVHIKKDKSNIYVDIQDYGAGIAPDMVDKIFDIYYRTSDAGEVKVKGLGVGLYISSEIIKKHHGTITVDSSPGKGSAFRITLPYT